jgi:hypothetical protein
MCRDIDLAKQNLSLFDYLGRPESRQYSNNTLRLKTCPMCQKTNVYHFVIYLNTNTYSSFNHCCKGGDILNFMVEVEGRTNIEAVKRLLEATNIKNDIIRHVPKKPRQFKEFYAKLTDEFKRWSKNLEIAKEKMDCDRILFCELNRNFFDQITDEFINNGYFERNDYLVGLEDGIKENYKKNVLDIYNIIKGKQEKTVKNFIICRIPKGY